MATRIQIETINIADAWKRNAATVMLDDLIELDMDCEDAADFVQRHTGIDVLAFYDPMAPDYAKLGRERLPATLRAASRDVAEGPGIQ